ncbi:MAG: hypothetical protein ACC660_00240 [Acidimicrobiales bacterium]
MVVTLWSVKGGVGCSVVAALLALHQADINGSALVDINGDLPAILGCPVPPGAGVAEWLRTGSDGPPDGLARIATDVGPGLQLIGRGQEPLPAGDPSDVLLRQLDAFPGSVVIDAGLVWGSSPRAALARWLAGHSTRSVLVTRACYIALTRAQRAPLAPSGIIVVTEPGRALGISDIEASVGAPVIAKVAYDMAVARAVDSGLLTSRYPRGLRRALQNVA